MMSKSQPSAFGGPALWQCLPRSFLTLLLSLRASCLVKSVIGKELGDRSCQLSGDSASTTFSLMAGLHSSRKTRTLVYLFTGPWEVISPVVELGKPRLRV